MTTQSIHPTLKESFYGRQAHIDKHGCAPLECPLRAKALCRACLRVLAAWSVKIGSMMSDEHQSSLGDYRRQLSASMREAYEASPKRCKFCGNNIPYEKRRLQFCGQSCSASYNNQGVTRHIKGSKLCECGKPKKPHNKYCADCSSSHLYHRSRSVEAAKTDEARKRLLIEQRGYQCEGCGNSEWRGKPIPIELHHVDGNSDNNLQSNLQLLCPNCHAQTDNHKRRNKLGKRQIARRKRYEDGQTW